MRTSDKVQPRTEELNKENRSAPENKYHLVPTPQPKSLLGHIKRHHSKRNKDEPQIAHTRSCSYPSQPLSAVVTLPSAPASPGRPVEPSSLVQLSSQSRTELLKDLKESVVASLALSTPVRYPLLDLSSQSLHDRDLPALARLLEVYPYAQALDLYGNELNFDTAPSPNFSIHFHLRRLHLSRNRGLKVGEGLEALLTRLPRLEILYLEGCELDDSDVIRLCDILEGLDRLTTLSLASNPITESVFPVLQTLLARLPDLNLVLKETEIHSKGAFAMRIHTSPSQSCCLLW